MLSVVDIYKTISERLKDCFDLPIYGYEVVEGYRKPSFFLDFRSRISEAVNINTIYRECSVKITYFQDSTDTLDNLMKIDALQRLFTSKLEVNGRFLNTSNLSYEYVGEDSNILQYSFDLAFYDDSERASDPHEKAGTLEITVRKEGL